MARINLIAWDNGVGLSTDLRLLEERLRQHGHRVTLSTLRRGKWRKIFRPIFVRTRIAAQRAAGKQVRQFDINIFLEHIRPEYLPLAHSNVLIPNPEWFDANDRDRIASLQGVLAKTRHAETIFRPLIASTQFIGFTSRDLREADIVRRRAFFHLAGRSQNKNTEPLLELWRRHPEWPTLTVVQNPRTANPGVPAANIDHRVDYLDAAQLRRLQNEHAFHICPSQTEGFGHYLMEAIGIGAVTITLDAAPMNELVAPDHGMLVAAKPMGTQALSAIYTFDDADMERVIGECIAMPDARIAELSAVARDFYESNDRRFGECLGEAIAAISA
ncbi:MAG TPA: glycosyltransferase [Rudaea sp.]|jgi:hypothetical protein|nr:glycosyltransferase [Rudaea sp.]